MAVVRSATAHGESVVFIIDKPHSHLYASMGLARRLEQLGYTVEYWGHDQTAPLIREQGFGFRPIAGLWSRYQDEVRMRRVSPWLKWIAYPGLVLENLAARRRWLPRLPAAVTACEQSIRALVSVRRPDLVVFDPFLLAYFPIFRRLRISCVVLSTKPVPTRDPLVPPYSSYVVPSPGPIGRLKVATAWSLARLRACCRWLAVRLAHRLGAYTHDTLVNHVAARNGIDVSTDRVERCVQPDLHFRSVQEWALWSPVMDLPRLRPLPDNIRYVGPSVDFGRRAVTAPMTKSADTRYLIYVAVGTIRIRWRDHVSFLRRVVQAFADQPGIRVLISAGSSDTVAAIGPVPSNIEVFEFLSQIECVAAADLVITHAGAGTLRECIVMERPMLAYPNHHDQNGNSARIVYHGLGLRGRRRYDSAETIRRKAMRVLTDERVRANLHAMRVAVECHDERLLVDALAAARRDVAGSSVNAPSVHAARSA